MKRKAGLEGADTHVFSAALHRWHHPEVTDEYVLIGRVPGTPNLEANWVRLRPEVSRKSENHTLKVKRFHQKSDMCDSDSGLQWWMQNFPDGTP